MNNDATLAKALSGKREAARQFGPRDLDACIDAGHFRVEYQPKISLVSDTSNSQFGVESLCRLSDPHFGAVSPDKFIAVAEQNGLIAKLTDAVTREAFTAWQSWKNAGLNLRIALNVSPLLLDNTDWSNQLLHRCEEFGMDSKWITLEITETAAGATSPTACEILTSLHKKGFSLSIDDFGTGFSSLATLYRLPISEMKIDKSFIFDLKDGARSLVESAIEMAKKMGIKVVAEGVESENVFHELRKMGCHEVQGFYVGRSMKADAIVPFFTNWTKTLEASPGAGAQVMPKAAVIQALVNDIANDPSLAPQPMRVGPYRVAAVQTAGSADITKDLIRKIPALVLAGKTIPALALCQEALKQLKHLAVSNGIHTKIVGLQEKLEQELLTSVDLELHTPQRLFRLCAREQVTIGRPAPKVQIDIPMNYRWFAPGDKNLRIFARADSWFVEDSGSPHGYLFDDSRLMARKPVELPFGRSYIQPRMAAGVGAPLSLSLTRTRSNPNAIVVEMDGDPAVLRKEVGEKDWPDLLRELNSSWVIFNGPIAIGNALDSTINLSDCGLSHAATVWFDKYYWISPATNRGMLLDGAAFYQDMPLPRGAELALGESRIAVQQARAHVPVQTARASAR